MLNPHTATITRPDGTPDVSQFRLTYLSAGSPIAELLVGANYVTANQYVQTLDGLNALVPAANQGGDLVLTASAINVGGESSATACDETIQVINPPAAPASVAVS